MAVNVLALESGVTTLEGHRLGLTGFTQSKGPINGRSGIYPAAGAADLATVSAMVCSIAPFSAWIDGTSTATQGGYPFTLNATVNLTFDPGNAATIRTDRIVAWVKDDTYDSSGATAGSVEIVKGNTTTGAANAVPANAMLLYEVAVPVGASAGGAGINFSTAVTDSRAYTSASGGVVKVANSTQRDAIASPYPGMLAYREDVGWMERYVTTWRPVGVPSVASVANLSLITNPSSGDLAVVTASGLLYRYNGSAWVIASSGFIVARGTRATNTTAQATAHGILRISGIPVLAGRQYRIYTGVLHALSTVNNDYVEFTIKYTTNGSDASVASNVMDGASAYGSLTNVFSINDMGPIQTVYTPATDHNLSIALCIARVQGTGNVNAFGDAGRLIQLVVEDIGLAVTSTGVSL